MTSAGVASLNGLAVVDHSPELALLADSPVEVVCEGDTAVGVLARELWSSTVLISAVVLALFSLPSAVVLCSAPVMIDCAVVEDSAGGVGGVVSSTEAIVFCPPLTSVGGTVGVVL